MAQRAKKASVTYQADSTVTTFSIIVASNAIKSACNSETNILTIIKLCEDLWKHSITELFI